MHRFILSLVECQVNELLIMILPHDFRSTIENFRGDAVVNSTIVSDEFI